MMSFSERMGFVKPPEFMQLNDMTEELSNLLWNFFVKTLEKAFPTTWDSESDLSEIQYELNVMFKKKDREFCIEDGYGHFSERRALSSYNKLNWHQKYSLCEYVAHFLFNESKKELNQILERENSGYRLNANCQLVPVANQEELSEVTKAQHSKVDAVALHMNKAVACFADREKPDYDNSIKEAVSALEAIAQKLTGEKGTLGTLIKKLDLHPSLREAVSKLYGYASDGGIRHAKKEGDPEADFDTAKFVIVTASALINFITAKCIPS